MSRQWNSIEKGFCENLFGGYPEIINCITSFTMLFVGLCGLFRSDLKPFVIKSIYTDFIINWFGSFFLHYYGFIFYGHIDTISLLCISWSLSYIIFTGIFSFINNKKSRELLEDFWALFVRTFLILNIASIVVSGKVWNLDFGFVESFVVPNVFNIVGMVILFILTIRKLVLKVFVYLGIGLFFMVVTVIIWGSTEPYCQKIRDTGESPNKFMFVSHGIWHVFFSIGVHYFIQCVLYMTCIAVSKPVFFLTSDSKCGRILDYIIPVVTIDLEKD